MNIRPLRAEKPEVRRYVEELWLPYHRELEAIVDDHALAHDVDLVDEEVEFRLARLGEPDYRAWVAVDEGDFAGFITCEVNEAPAVFDRPDRLLVGDFYVREPYRGTGLACDLLDRAANQARDAGCAELTLDVDVDNDRALAFYDKLGFEVYRHQMTLGVDDL